MEKIELVYGNTPKNQKAKIERARKAALGDIIANHVGEVIINYWAKNGIERIYIQDANENNIGYIGIRKIARQSDGSYYENHRSAKGETFNNYSTDTKCPAEIVEKVECALNEYMVRTNQEHRLTEKYGEQFTYTFGALSDY